MTHMLECMARADEMNADVKIWRNKIIVGKMCYVKVICGR